MKVSENIFTANTTIGRWTNISVNTEKVTMAMNKVPNVLPMFAVDTWLVFLLH